MTDQSLRDAADKKFGSDDNLDEVMKHETWGSD